jgi:hypothetical protein
MNVDQLLAEPQRRRLWLLAEAMACAPLDHALKLAREADQFVLGEAEPATTEGEIVETAPAQSVPCNCASARFETEEKPKNSVMPLSAERRGELLDRLARGEKNAALAAEFGLSPQQVQGFRMGAARTIASRRSSGANHAPDDRSTRISASIEDVVRYLRQQDDVVVPEGDNRYLVNGRFHLELPELLEKANKIRERRNKPLFQLEGLPSATLSHHSLHPSG